MSGADLLAEWARELDRLFGDVHAPATVTVEPVEFSAAGAHFADGWQLRVRAERLTERGRETRVDEIVPRRDRFEFRRYGHTFPTAQAAIDHMAAWADAGCAPLPFGEAS